MELTTCLLDGAELTLTTTDSPVTGFGTPIRSSVLAVEGLELEVNAGDSTAADFFFTATGSTAGPLVQLRAGHGLRTGSYGGRADQGLAWRVDVGAESLFGVTPPTMTLETLAAALSSAGIRTGRAGLRLRPAGAVSWSAHRTHDLAVSATGAPEQSVLLDVRRTLREPPPGRRGRRVRGGWLSRSDPNDRVHVVLESDDTIAYGLPPTEEDLDLAVEVLADLEIELREESP